jgi:hypothetical protein
MECLEAIKWIKNQEKLRLFGLQSVSPAYNEAYFSDVK